MSTDIDPEKSMPVFSERTYQQLKTACLQATETLWTTAGSAAEREAAEGLSSKR